MPEPRKAAPRKRAPAKKAAPRKAPAKRAPASAPVPDVLQHEDAITPELQAANDARVAQLTKQAREVAQREGKKLGKLSGSASQTGAVAGPGFSWSLAENLGLIAAIEPPRMYLVQRTDRYGIREVMSGKDTWTQDLAVAQLFTHEQVVKLVAKFSIEQEAEREKTKESGPSAYSRNRGWTYTAPAVDSVLREIQQLREDDDVEACFLNLKALGFTPEQLRKDRLAEAEKILAASFERFRTLLHA